MIKVKKGKVKCTFKTIGNATEDMEALLSYINEHTLDLGVGALAPILQKYATYYQNRIDDAIERRNNYIAAKEKQRIKDLEEKEKIQVAWEEEGER